MTRRVPGERTYVSEDELAATHQAIALVELRSQGCTHTELSYDEDHDAYFCELCNIWGEAACGDRRCHYCARRPAVPSLVRRD